MTQARRFPRGVLAPAAWAALGSLVAASGRDAKIDVGWVSVHRWRSHHRSGGFLIGAAAWRLEHQRPLHEALPIIHRDLRLWGRIHTWMIAALVPTPAGPKGLILVLGEPTATRLAGMETGVYGIGGVCRIVSLAFRLTAVPWAAGRAVASGHVPDDLAAY
jgi:hypothetical protein